MAYKGNNALSLLSSYDSDSDRDSGYTSEEERKRKHNFFNPREKKSKKLKANYDEEMLVDGENSNWFSTKVENEKNNAPDTFGQCSSLFTENSTMLNHSKKLKESKDLISQSSDMSSQSKRLIPLPKELQVTCECNEDPSLHQGRARSFPHERGNWASLIYIPLTFGIFNPHLNSLLAVLITTCNDFKLEIFQSSDYHVSLSRTFILRLEWIQPFVQDFKKKLSKFKKFSMWLHGLAVFCNEEKTRTFIGLKVGHGKYEMKDVTALADESLEKYNLPSFYEDNSFHVSIAWCHGNKEEDLEKVLPLLQGVCDQYFNLESDMRTFDVTDIHLKTGNKVHTIPLDHT